VASTAASERPEEAKMEVNNEIRPSTSVAEVWTVRSPGAWIFVVRGELDIHSSAEMRDDLAKAIAASVPTILVDMEETTFLDPVGLGVLIDALHSGDAAGTALRLVAPSEQVLRLLHLTQLVDLFEVETNLSDAYPKVA
jgi:anti-sigma B factor antagonist